MKPTDDYSEAVSGGRQLIKSSSVIAPLVNSTTRTQASRPRHALRPWTTRDTDGRETLARRENSETVSFFAFRYLAIGCVMG